MKKTIRIKPLKKTDKELYKLISESIRFNNYIFSKHAKKRSTDRAITDLVALNILEGQNRYKRKRNKRKDRYEEGQQDWKYCIEGEDLERTKIRIIISFEDNCLLVITIIRID